MADFEKNQVNDEELDNVSGGANMSGDVGGTWLYKFEYQEAPGRFKSVVSKVKYRTEARARRAGTMARFKYLSKKASPLVVFEQR